MHVLIIPSEEFVPANKPVAGIFQFHQADALKEAGYKTGVLSIKQTFSLPMLAKAILWRFIGRRPNNDTGKFSIGGLFRLGYRKLFKLEDFLTIEDKEGIQVFRIDGLYYLPPSDKNNRWGWIKAGEVAYKAYIKRNGRPDIIHAHNAMYAGMLAKKISIREKIPYLVTEHSTVFARKTITDRKLLQHIEQVYHDCKGAYAVSAPFSRLLREMFPGISFNYLPNVIDPYLEKKKLDINHTPKREFIFLNIAELHPKKDQMLLIKSFRKLKQAHPDRSMKLWIGGEGALYDELVSYVRENELSEDVRFLGYLNREQVFEAIRQSDCFVLSSLYETFGVVLIEAMLLGKPVVSTKSGGPEGFVTEKVGILTEKHDAGQLAAAMGSIMMNYTVYNSTEIRQYVIQEFGREAFVAKLGKIYHASIDPV